MYKTIIICKKWISEGGWTDGIGTELKCLVYMVLALGQGSSRQTGKDMGGISSNTRIKVIC